MAETQLTSGRPLRVCFYVFFPGGGIGRYTRELCRELGSIRNLSVDVACTPDFEWRDDSAFTAWPNLGLISHPIPLVRRALFLRGQFRNPIAAVEHAVATGADVLHFSNVNHLTFPVWRRALREAGLPMVVSVHDVRRQKSILNRTWEERQLKSVYRFADALFVHSHYQASELVDFAGVDAGKIHVVPHGPYPYGAPPADRDSLRAKLGLPEDKQVALFFGQIRNEKNLDRLIQAMALSQTKPHLLVAGRAGGRHHDLDYYRERAVRFGVADRIIFDDRFIPDEEVSSLFTACDWVALPYRRSFTSQSGVLNVAVEYDRPVLVSSSPVLKETVATCDIGEICEGDTVAAISAGMDRLHARVARGDTFAFESYRRNYAWAENARRTLAVYQDLIDRSKKASGS
ncbi:MAG TPA: glycosyltransferase family 4 protein [Rhodothermales bacterium]